MGKNQRYGSDLSEEAILEAILRPQPVSLTRREVGEEIIVPETGAPLVRAWVRFPETSVELSGRAIAWTKKAVCVEFTLRDGQVRRAWVWASAVSRA
ncbi:hypothetical protein [Naasia sp. SYSU D00057]|uniref:hypothetical protein n=1 Tax=Naasia sp. SYSU D00057 TaxID=2817380 RepID=UPI001B3118FB|nr:hypothetical protein [Naasia sp. SYSU D00057]